MKKKTASYWLFLLPSLLGVLVFYVVPFGYSLYYALIDNMGVPGVCGAEELFRHPDKLPVPERGLQQRRVHGDLRPPGHGFGPGAVPVPAEDETGPGGRHHGAPAAPGSPLGDHRVLLESAVRFKRPGKRTAFAAGPLPPVGEPEPVAHGHFSGHLSVEERELQHRAVLVGPNWIPKTYYEQMELEGAGPGPSSGT